MCPLRRIRTARRQNPGGPTARQDRRTCRHSPPSTRRIDATIDSPIFCSAWLAALAMLPVAPTAFAQDATLPAREPLLQAFRDGNFKEAYDGLQRLARCRRTPTRRRSTTTCRPRCNACGSSIASTRSTRCWNRSSPPIRDSWQALAAVARQYDSHRTLRLHDRRRVSPRPASRRRSRRARHGPRPRARAAALSPRHRAGERGAEQERRGAACCAGFAQALAYGGDTSQYWRLQSLTDLETLPDYRRRLGLRLQRPARRTGRRRRQPDLLRRARQLGRRQERRRALAVGAGDDGRLGSQDARRRTASRGPRFCRRSSTCKRWPASRSRCFASRSDDATDAPQTWALDTLGEDETIARLATGIKRFKLPDDHNFIKLYQQVARAPAAGRTRVGVRTALDAARHDLRESPAVRRAAEYWRHGRSSASPATSGSNIRIASTRSSATGASSAASLTQPAGRGATVDFRFRNAKDVEFTAQPINVAKLLADVKDYLKSKPKQLDWQQAQHRRHRLSPRPARREAVRRRGSRPLEAGARAARRSISTSASRSPRRCKKPAPIWSRPRSPAATRRKIVLWLADTAIVRKPLADKSLYFVADAVTGAPLAKANVEFFGYRVKHDTADGNDRARIRNPSRELRREHRRRRPGLPAARRRQGPRRSSNGSPSPRTPTAGSPTSASTTSGAAAYYDPQYNQVKAFAITDRPVYRPDQTVKFKFWVRHAQYDRDDTSAVRPPVVPGRDPQPQGREGLRRNAHVRRLRRHRRQVRAARRRHARAVLSAGRQPRRRHLPRRGIQEAGVRSHRRRADRAGHARREDHRHDPREVLLRLARHQRHGEVQGAAHASTRARWYPPAPWDWLYGPGYWWFAYDYAWYPGWREWGCLRPAPSGGAGSRPQPPEIVAEREVPIGPDGTRRRSRSTRRSPRPSHPDQDHRYAIQAEVVDQSRRTIVGSGEVLVARKPFRVFAWVDRGYYRVGDTIDGQLRRPPARRQAASKAPASCGC